MLHPTHLLLDGADRYPTDALPPLPRLQRALQAWQHQHTQTQSSDAPLTPAEALHTQLLGIPDEAGHHPFAALAHGTVGQPCAWVTPCQIQLGMDRAELHDPQHLQLGEDESRQLMAGIAPLFEELGLSLEYESPLRWFARGELLRDAHCRSLAQAVSQPLRLDALAPMASRQPEAARRQLQRLLNEVQMQLYTHPVTDARAARRATPVNAIWLHGAGALPESTGLVSPSEIQHIQLDTRLAQAAEQGPQAWAAMWQQLDEELPPLLAQWQAASGESSLNFCGLNARLTLRPGPSGFTASVMRLLRTDTTLPQWLAPLHAEAMA